jgi:thiamine pyrophosphate-dependent acetolactate synthase large subunit-like protein
MQSPARAGNAQQATRSVRCLPATAFRRTTVSLPDSWPRIARGSSPLSGTPFTDGYLCQQLALLRPPGTIIVEEAPSTRGSMHDYLPILERDTFYTCASGGLGHGLPAAVGVALGSSMYAIQGLWTAAQLKLPITFIIVNNRRYEALEQFGRHFGLARTVGTSLAEIDFRGLAISQAARRCVSSAPRRWTRPCARPWSQRSRRWWRWLLKVRFQTNESP